MNDRTPQDRIHEITMDPLGLEGILGVPKKVSGIVLFAHGSGSSRHSPRNKLVAEALRKVGVATLLFDLLTEKEAQDRANIFDIPLLGRRLLDATSWIKQYPDTATLPVGYFGASTGAAATLVAAASGAWEIAAIVSRGGRPDLAGQALTQVKAPTLLIVGEKDREVLELNRLALAKLRCTKSLIVVRGATHLFEESGALEQVVHLARGWLVTHLAFT